MEVSRRTIGLPGVEGEALRGADRQVGALVARRREVDQRQADGALVVVQLRDARRRRRGRVDGAHAAGPLPGGALQRPELRLRRRAVVVQLRALCVLGGFVSPAALSLAMLGVPQNTPHGCSARVCLQNLAVPSW